MLLMLMMLPLPRAAMPGASAATRRYGARTLLANSASNMSAFRSAVAPNQENPALLTSTSTWPASAARRSMLSGSPRSAATNRACPPDSSICSTARAPRPASRPCTMTSKPSRARAVAMARPMPEVAPVTSAVWAPGPEFSVAVMTPPCARFRQLRPSTSRRRTRRGREQCSAEHSFCWFLPGIRPLTILRSEAMTGYPQHDCTWRAGPGQPARARKRARDGRRPAPALGRPSGDEIEEGLVDLAGVGPDDRVRPAFYDDAADVPDQGRQPVSGRLGGQDAVLAALHDQDRDVDPGQVAAEVLQPRGCAAEGGPRRGPDGDVEAVLPGLVADVAAAEEVDVVELVEEGLRRGWPVVADIGHKLVEDAAVNPLRVVAGPQEEWRQGRQQRRGPDAPGAIGRQVTGHLAGPG